MKLGHRIHIATVFAIDHIAQQCSARRIHTGHTQLGVIACADFGAAVAVGAIGCTEQFVVSVHNRLEFCRGICFGSVDHGRCQCIVDGSDVVRIHTAHAGLGIRVNIRHGARCLRHACCVELSELAQCLQCSADVVNHGLKTAERIGLAAVVDFAGDGGQHRHHVVWRHATQADQVQVGFCECGRGCAPCSGLLDGVGNAGQFIDLAHRVHTSGALSTHNAVEQGKVVCVCGRRADLRTNDLVIDACRRLICCNIGRTAIGCVPNFRIVLDDSLNLVQRDAARQGPDLVQRAHHGIHGIHPRLRTTVTEEFFVDGRSCQSRRSAQVGQHFVTPFDQKNLTQQVQLSRCALPLDTGCEQVQACGQRAASQVVNTCQTRQQHAIFLSNSQAVGRVEGIGIDDHRRVGDVLCLKAQRMGNRFVVQIGRKGRWGLTLLDLTGLNGQPNSQFSDRCNAHIEPGVVVAVASVAAVVRGNQGAHRHPQIDIQTSRLVVVIEELSIAVNQFKQHSPLIVAPAFRLDLHRPRRTSSEGVTPHFVSLLVIGNDCQTIKHHTQKGGCQNIQVHSMQLNQGLDLRDAADTDT